MTRVNGPKVCTDSPVAELLTVMPVVPVTEKALGGRIFEDDSSYRSGSEPAKLSPLLGTHLNQTTKEIRT